MMSSENPDTTCLKLVSSSENMNNEEMIGDPSDINYRQGNSGGRGRRRGGNWRQNHQRRNFSPNNRQRDETNEMVDHGFVPRNIMLEKLSEISGPTHNLPPLELNDKKFCGRNRLYIGNLSNEVTENDIIELLGTYGETLHPFFNKEKHFAFITLDYNANAEKAKCELDGIMLKDKMIKIRSAPSVATVKVSNLSNFVTNELLYHGFQIFGEIERAVVLVDERGKSKCKGFVDFVRKASANSAIRKCTDECFFLTASLRPCIVESFDSSSNSDGYSDKQFYRKSLDYLKDREVGPRFAQPNTFEHDYGARWKQLHELYTQKKQALKRELELEKEKLEAQMEFARYERETEMLREEIRVREMLRERQKNEWERRERMVDQQKQRMDEEMRRQEEELTEQMKRTNDDMSRRRGGGNSLLFTHQLDNNNVNVKEEKLRFQPPEENTDNDNNVIAPKALMDFYNYKMNPRGNAPKWRNSRMDEFENKRRRRL